MTMVIVWPIEPKSIRGRRPTRSMRKIAIKLARKYSVPFAAAMIRELTSLIPRPWKRIVCANRSQNFEHRSEQGQRRLTA